MTVLVTGVAGFIGFHVAGALLARGEQIVGIDNLNDYYDPALKAARLAQLGDRRGFAFEQLDFADESAMLDLRRRHAGITGIVHLGAQAGVRYSLENPRAYLRSNLAGQMEILELARALPRLEHLVYASSSSVYGGSRTLPFSLDERCETPQSLYAATKRADELMSASYSHLYGIKATGLRFFTVYGPWGRPDMSVYIFTKAILEGAPIRLFNHGDMRRDFTHIDDIVPGVLAALDHPPADEAGLPPHRLYNLGNHRAEELRRLVSLIETACGVKAKIELAPMQAGDVYETFADIAASQRDLGFAPRVSIDDGIPGFVAWYRAYHGV